MAVPIAHLLLRVVAGTLLVIISCGCCDSSSSTQEADATGATDATELVGLAAAEDDDS